MRSIAFQIRKICELLHTRGRFKSSADTPYETAAPFLPRSLGEALQSLRENKTLRGAFGGGFIDYFIHIKEAELARFEQEASEWEHREYFDLF